MSDLPAQPLLDFIERRGGVIEFFPYHEIDVSHPDARRDNALRATHPDDRNSYLAALAAVSRARRKGRIGYLSVDSLCGRLRIHPVDVYGDDWFDFDALGVDAA